MEIRIPKNKFPALFFYVSCVVMLVFWDKHHFSSALSRLTYIDGSLVTTLPLKKKKKANHFTWAPPSDIHHWKCNDCAIICTHTSALGAMYTALAVGLVVKRRMRASSAQAVLPLPVGAHTSTLASPSCSSWNTYIGMLRTTS